MLVAIYARVSIDPSQSTRIGATVYHQQTEENQIFELTKFCETQNYSIYKTYVDRISGSKDIKDRPAFKQMFKDAYMRKFDMILFWSLDRFSREGTLKTLKYLEELESYKVGWKSFTEQHLDSMGIFKDVVISLMATMAKQERIRISERTKAGIARRKAQGLKIGGPKKKVDEREFIKCFNEGYTYPAIGRRFDISYQTAKRIAAELIERKELEPVQDQKITLRDLKREELRKKFMNLRS